MLSQDNGPCVFCGCPSQAAEAKDSVLSAWYGSRHDGTYFVWLDQSPHQEGPVCDACIDRLQSENRIGAYHSVIGAAADEQSKATIESAFRLGASRAEAAMAAARLMEAGAIDGARAALPRSWRRDCLDGTDPVGFVADMLAPPPSDVVINLVPRDDPPDAYRAGVAAAVASRAVLSTPLTGPDLDAAAVRFSAAVLRARDTRACVLSMLTSAALTNPAEEEE